MSSEPDDFTPEEIVLITDRGDIYFGLGDEQKEDIRLLYEHIKELGDSAIDNICFGHVSDVTTGLAISTLTDNYTSSDGADYIVIPKDIFFKVIRILYKETKYAGFLSR